MRKQIDLDEKTIKALKKLAEKDKRKLKPFIEKILIDYANIESMPHFGKPGKN